MKTTLVLHTIGRHRRVLFALALCLIALILIPDPRRLLWDLARGIHQGFLAVYVDAASFVSGCF